MLNVLKVMWQLPQTVVGLIVWFVTDNSYDRGVYKWDFKSGVSLGPFVFVRYNCSTNTIKHERGHQKQSLMLGPLYLLVIGLPSLCGNLLHRIIKFDYYKQPWEAWADRLGGVYR